MMDMGFYELFSRIIMPALAKTTYMVVMAALLSTAFGFCIAVMMVMSDADGLRPNKVFFSILNSSVNIIRSFPFVILLVSIIPFTRFIAGTSIGEKAALIPLTLASAPFVARLFEVSLKSVDRCLIEAAKSFGASDWQIVFRVMVREAIPSLTANVTLAIISILGATAMAGAVGAGGLGAVALTYGYQNFNDTIMYSTVIVLVIIVQLIQSLGNIVYDRLK